MKVKYEIVAPNGKYNKDGQEKTRWQNVGVLLEGDDGRMAIALDKTFNPAGAATRNPDDSRVFLSCFEPRAKGGAGGATKPATQAEPFNDDIPF